MRVSTAEINQWGRYRTGQKAPESGVYECYSCSCWPCTRKKVFRKGTRLTTCSGCKKTAEWSLKEATTGKKASRRGLLDFFS